MIWVFQAQRQEREGLELSMKSMRINYEEMIEELKKQNEMQQFQYAELKKQIESLKRKK